ncbi:MAG: DNA photolyase family protein [Alphaproteobacteria bacterium]|nr:DNA photolyase family protein [Alphaproteobacteria bacterium]
MFYICSMKNLHVVWYKRDLRVHDHAPLLAAVASGEPVLPLYIFEPDFWALPEHSGRQFDFMMESLRSLDEALKARGSALTIRVGEATQVLAELHRRHGLAAIHTHEEIGLQWSLDRDRAVQRWALKAGISLREQPQNGVIRRRDGHGDEWLRKWEAWMLAPRAKAPDAIKPSEVSAGEWPMADDLRLKTDVCPGRQPGGRAEGVELLRSFIASRGRRYRTAMDSPQSATGACSRLSPHFTFGTLSIREAYQGAMRARTELELDGDSTFAASLDTFLSRLQWHCHFLQKLSDQTSINSRNMHTEPDGLRDRVSDGDPRLEAWISGRTGFPFLDACMRALNATGWLNHRMRAMVMAFSTQHLWMDWQHPAARLAALFTDFEAGIHYPQAQKQAGARGQSIPRIYNPVKQSMDHDRDGAFIRRWVPELAGLSNAHIHAPWDAPKGELSRAGIVLGQTYPMRIVDHMAAAREARDRIYAGQPGAGRENRAERSRTHLVTLQPRPSSGRLRPQNSPSRQLAFDLQMPEAAERRSSSRA